MQRPAKPRTPVRFRPPPPVNQSLTSKPSAFIQLYRRELLVKIENQEFWIPIQELLLEPLAEELPKGGELDLYVLLGF